MASSGSFNSKTMTWDSSGTTVTTYFRYSWEIKSQDSATNRSVISWKITTVQTPTGSGWKRTVKSGSSIVVNGNTVATTSDIGAYNSLVVQQGETTIYHEADGTKDFTVQFKYKIGSSSVNCDGTHTFTLDPIALNPMVNFKASGSWKSGYPYIKVGGSWKKATEVYVKVGGSWKTVSVRG